MTRPDLDALEAVARAATRGPWFNNPNRSSGPGAFDIFGPAGVGSGTIGSCDIGTLAYRYDNAPHIATFNPAAMLKLITYIRELEGARDNITGQLLYETFWRRNLLPDPVPYFKQAPAIMAMWNEIATDARTALRTTGGEEVR